METTLARGVIRSTLRRRKRAALGDVNTQWRRVVSKLLHAPTVRVKELAGSPGGEEYAAALRVLFDLDPRTVEAVTRAAPEAVVHPVRRRAAGSSYRYPDHGGTR